MIFELFQKLHLLIYAIKIHDIINYSIFPCPLKSGKCGKEEKHYIYLNISRTKSFLDEIKKTFFIIFEGLLFGGQIVDTSFKYTKKSMTRSHLLSNPE